MADFLAMGGYAAFVWPAYGISFLVLAGAVIWTIAAERAARRRLSQVQGGKP